MTRLSSYVARIAQIGSVDLLVAEGADIVIIGLVLSANMIGIGIRAALRIHAFTMTRLSGYVARIAQIGSVDLLVAKGADIVVIGLVLSAHVLLLLLTLLTSTAFAVLGSSGNVGDSIRGVDVAVAQGTLRQTVAVLRSNVLGFRAGAALRIHARSVARLSSYVACIAQIRSVDLLVAKRADMVVVLDILSSHVLLLRTGFLGLATTITRLVRRYSEHNGSLLVLLHVLHVLKKFSKERPKLALLNNKIGRTSKQ